MLRLTFFIETSFQKHVYTGRFITYKTEINRNIMEQSIMEHRKPRNIPQFNANSFNPGPNG